MRHHLTPIRMLSKIFFKFLVKEKNGVGEDMEKLKHWCAAGGNVK